jgi:hypothetical protein
MRLLLVNIGNGSEIRIPQGLLYLASAVEAAGHTVTTHDEALAADWGQSLEKILASDADMIGLSVYTGRDIAGHKVHPQIDAGNMGRVASNVVSETLHT